MKKLWLSLFFAVLFALPVMAGDFNSIHPPFGTALSELDNADYFVKYMEKEGVAYYNYLGPRMKDPIYEHSAPHMVYAFVQGKLYARISRSWGEDKAVIFTNMRKVFGEPSKSYEEDGWSVCQWDALKGDDITFKVKFNNATREVKTAHYFNPLSKAAKGQL